MTSFLFWNVGQRNLCPLLGRAVKQYGIDVLMLAESPTDDATVTTSLRSTSGLVFFAHSDRRSKVRVFSKLAPRRWRRHVPATDRLVVWNVEFGPPEGFLLMGAHGIAKNNLEADEQALLAVEMAKEIRFVEEIVGHCRTVLVGDLNMNPFEMGMIGANALQAVMTRSVAGRKERVVQGNRFPFFTIRCGACLAIAHQGQQEPIIIPAVSPKPTGICSTKFFYDRHSWTSCKTCKYLLQ